MASVVQKYMTALRLWGWRELLTKMYSVSESPILPMSNSSMPVPFLVGKLMVGHQRLRSILH